MLCDRFPTASDTTMPDLIVLPEFASANRPVEDEAAIRPLDATHVGGVAEAFHGWYPYLEGYSPAFVRTVLERYAPEPSPVLDPFAGTAVTGFVAAEMARPAFLGEVNPVLQFILNTKVRARTLRGVRRRALCADLMRLAETLPYLVASARPDGGLDAAYRSAFGQSEFFDPEQYAVVLRLRSLIDELAAGSALASACVAVAVLASLVPSSRLQRAGDVRYKTAKELERIPALLAEIVRRTGLMAGDIAATAPLATAPILICEDARGLRRIPRLSVGAVVTSPPYANGTNYFRNTKLELWFLRCLSTPADLRRFRRLAITSGINDVTVEKSVASTHPDVLAVVARLSKDAYDTRIPLLVGSYFAELEEVFRGIAPHLRHGAAVAIDIGDSIYNGVHVHTDELLAGCLVRHGYELAHSIRLRNRSSKNGAALSQTLLVFEFAKRPNVHGIHPTPVAAPESPAAPAWAKGWTHFIRDVPHQAAPFAKRNWGSSLHSLCSYPGKLKPAIAHHLVKAFVPDGGRMLDPFAGVGTIPFEAAILGRVAFGIELSPAAHAVAAAKLSISDATDTGWVLEQLQQAIDTCVPTPEELMEARNFGLNGKIVDYFNADTLREVLGAKRFFLRDRTKTPSMYLVEAACLHVLHGNRPYAVSRRSHPLTPYAPSGATEYRSLMKRVRDKVARSLADQSAQSVVPGSMHLRDATEWWPAEIDGLDAVLTSPPFFDSTRYHTQNWLRLWFAGWSADDFATHPGRFIDERQKLGLDVYEPIFRQSRERLKDGGVLLLHLGRSSKCDMAGSLSRIARQWFAHSELFDESVEHCESHGLRDKGAVKAHQYLLLY